MIDIVLGQYTALNILIANAENESILKENSLTDKDWEEITSKILVVENYPTLNLVHSIYKNIRKTDIFKNQKVYFNLLKKYTKIYTESIPRQVEKLFSKKTTFEEFLDLKEEELKSTSKLVDTINIHQEIKLYFDTPFVDQRVKPLD
ncbi:hypothetical protein BC936DRAFT_141924, partial [Jimgerdemannia flammicorona]